jgi:MFS family permease
VTQGLIARILAPLVDLAQSMRLSFLPPLMVYVAAGISGLTGIVGTFYVKERLGLSAEFLAILGFWVGMPWAIKMPLGHIVDLIWRWKGWLVFLGALLIAASLSIMVGLLGYTDAMRAYAPVETWFVISAMLSPLGYVLQDVVADAMTVEAVPRVDTSGKAIPDDVLNEMHTTMQTLGRVAMVGGSVLVALVNIVVFNDVDKLSEAEKMAEYLFVYKLALIIPVVSVLGVLAGIALHWKRERELMRAGHTRSESRALLGVHGTHTKVDWWILAGGVAFVFFSLGVKALKVPLGEEIIFLGTFSIVVFLMAKMLSKLSAEMRREILGVAAVVFVFRALPSTGAGSGWWMIDVLKFDQSFFAQLSLIGSVFALAGMFIFRAFMARRSILYIYGFLAVIGTVLYLPTIGMYYGLHHWTEAHLGFGARTIAIIDTTLESPFAQLAMIPMLAWVAKNAPDELKATYFAVMASFTNLGLSLASLLTGYLNRMFVVTRDIKDPVTGAVKIPADYSELGTLMIVATIIGLLAPLLAIWLCRKWSRPRIQTNTSRS